MGCPAKWVVTHFLVLSVYLQTVFQRSYEVMGDTKVWGQSGTCSLQSPINELEFLEQATCSSLASFILISLFYAYGYFFFRYFWMPHVFLVC